MLLVAFVLTGVSVSAQSVITEGVLNRSGWTLSSPAAPSSAIEGAGDGRLAAAIDGNVSTYYHSDWSADTGQPGKDLPQYFIIDTGEAGFSNVQGFIYTPRPSNGNGTSTKMRVYVSSTAFDVSGGVTAEALTGKSYTPAADVTFEYSNETVNKMAAFTSPQSGRYVLVVSDNAKGAPANQYLTCAEFYLYTDKMAATKSDAIGIMDPVKNYSSLSVFGFTEDYYTNAVNAIRNTELTEDNYATAFASMKEIATTAKNNIINTLRTGKRVVTFENQANDDTRRGRFITATNNKALGVKNESTDESKWTLKFNENGTFKLYNVAWDVYLGDANSNAKMYKSANNAANYSFVVQSTANVVRLKDGANNILHQSNNSPFGYLTWNYDDAASNWLVEDVTLSGNTTERMWNDFNAYYDTEKAKAYSDYQTNYGLVTSGENIQVVVNHSSGGDSQPSSNLLDGDGNTYVHSSYGSDAGSDPHYIQVTLSEAQSKVLFYMKRRNDNNRPRTIKVYVSADGTTFGTEPVATLENLEGRSEVADYFSPEINLGGNYQYIRFVVTATNTGTKFFTLSEFYVLPVNENTAHLAKLGAAGPSTLKDLATELLGPQPISSVEQLSTTKVYAIMPEQYSTRGALYAPARAAQLTACGGTAGNAANTGIAINSNSPAQQFAFVKVADKYYLYSVSEHKFVTNTDSKAKINYTPADYVTIEPSSADEHFIIKFNGSNYLNISTGYGDAGCAVTGWNNEDGGNRMRITPVTDLADDADALAEFAQACLNLKAEVDRIPTMIGEIGSKVGQYTVSNYEGDYIAGHDAILNFYNGITYETTPADIAAKLADAKVVSNATVSLNMPQTGKFYRFKGSNHNRRLYASTVTVDSKGDILEMGDDTSTNLSKSVYYYDGSHLISYETGRALGAFAQNQFETWKLVNAGETGANVAFSKGNSAGQFYITLDGNRRINHANAGGYVDAGSGDATGEGYSWIIQEVEYLPINVNYNSVKYATFISPVALTLKDKIAAYTGKIENNALVLTPVEGVIPANTAVVLKAEEGVERGAEDKVYLQVTSAPVFTGSNDLVGHFETILASTVSSPYTLQNQSEGLGFYPFNGTTLAGFKAYLVNGSSVSRFLLPNGEVTGIDGIDADIDADQPIYDLSGRRVKNAQKGLYIIGGKKMVR